MSQWLVAATGIAYLWVCVEQAIKGNMPGALMYFGYAFANVGLFFAVK
jgi:hypothetical protein